MFKAGDIVRCTTHGYMMTSYLRPCEVIRGSVEGTIIVKPFDCIHTIEVSEESIELAPCEEILKQGQEIYIKGDNHKVVFKRYLNKGLIEILNGEWIEEIEISDATFKRVLCV